MNVSVRSGMELKRFDESFSNLTKMFKKGFYKKPTKIEIDVFSKIIDFQLQALIITSRLEEDITEEMAHTQYIFKCHKENIKPSNSEFKKSIIILFKLMLDLSDFYIYTRMFLDALTVGIRLSFINAGNKNACIMEHSVKCLLNEKNMKTYKEKIGQNFFDNLEKHLSWIRNLRESRNGLVHYYHHFVFTTTRQDKLGYDIMDREKDEWGIDTVKGVSNEIQTVINSLTDLMEYLHTNLPKKPKNDQRN